MNIQLRAYLLALILISPSFTRAHQTKHAASIDTSALLVMTAQISLFAAVVAYNWYYGTKESHHGHSHGHGCCGHAHAQEEGGCGDHDGAESGCCSGCGSGDGHPAYAESFGGQVGGHDHSSCSHDHSDCGHSHSHDSHDPAYADSYGGQVGGHDHSSCSHDHSHHTDCDHSHEHSDSCSHDHNHDDHSHEIHEHSETCSHDHAHCTHSHTAESTSHDIDPSELTLIDDYGDVIEIEMDNGESIGIFAPEFGSIHEFMGW